MVKKKSKIKSFLKKKENQFNLKLLLAFVFMVILDWATKFIVKRLNLNTYNKIVSITYTTNKGTLFGLFSNFEYINLIFIILSIIFLVLIFWFWTKEKDKSIPLLLVFSGIFSNLIDRLFYGSVVDWINVHFWPIFNIADSLIVIGVCWLIIIFLKEETNYKLKLN